MSKRTTKPGSHAHLIATVVAAATVEAGRGFEINEIRDAYEATGREIDDRRIFNAEVYSLVRRGHLVRAGGRTGRTRYCHRDHPVRSDDETWDDGLLVLRALRSAYRRIRRAVTTREVHKEARRLALPLSSDHPNLVRKRLETLARTRERGHPDWHEPQVEAVRTRSSTGRAVIYWRPAGTPPGDIEDMPWSGAETARGAFQKVQEELGRPATRRELRWWRDARVGEDPVAAAIDLKRLARDTRSATKWDREHVGDEGRLLQIEGDLSCHGGGAPHYAVGSVTAQQVAVCRIEELCSAFRPADEMEDIARLLDLADLLRSKDLEQFAHLRRSVLAYEIRRRFGEEGPLPSAAAARESIQRLEQWVETGKITADVRGTRRREVEDRDRQLAALEMLRFPRSIPDVAVVGEAGLAAVESLKPLLESAAELLDLDHRAQLRLMTEARRFPNPSVSPLDRFGDPDSQPLSLVDRVDAISAIFRAISLPRAGALLEDAERLVGRVLRDADLLERLMTHLPPHDHVARRAAAVALGLLGRAPKLTVAVPDPGDPDDTAAFVMAAILATPLEAYDRVREADSRATGSARAYVYEVVARVDVGDLLTAIE